MAEIKILKTTYKDTKDKIHKVGDSIECCGRPIRMAYHADGRDFYIYTYNCECGNVITSETKRDKGDCWF